MAELADAVAPRRRVLRRVRQARVPTAVDLGMPSDRNLHGTSATGWTTMPGRQETVT
jgi:hypothetical protein